MSNTAVGNKNINELLSRVRWYLGLKQILKMGDGIYGLKKSLIPAGMISPEAGGAFFILESYMRFAQICLNL